MIRNWTDLKIYVCINPSSPNGDQHQFSPKNIHTLSRDKVMRIYEMITKEKMLWSAIKCSLLILKGNVWRLVWRICTWILGLKGLLQAKGMQSLPLLWLSLFKLNVPGQPWLLHSPVSFSGPNSEQSLPPALGGGLVQERLRVWRPPPQVAEHWDHELHSE